jgi:Domain of unknown function (DUF4124)
MSDTPSRVNEETATMRARFIALSSLAVAGLSFSCAANADVVRCSDANGKTLYTDTACPAGAHAVGAIPVPQPCASDDCERRRERALMDARERVRAEKEQLAAYTADRHQREIEERRLDEARYEAELRSVQPAPVTADEVAYPVYPIAGFPSWCGKRCLKNHHPRFKIAGIRIHENRVVNDNVHAARHVGIEGRRRAPPTANRMVTSDLSPRNR